MTPTAKETMRRLLWETIEYYNADPARRASVSGRCEYRDKQGNRCAIGRLLTPAELRLIEDRNGLKETLGNLLEEIVDLEELPTLAALERELGVDFDCFLSDLQELHDADTNWATDGISPRGSRTAAFLIEKFDLYEELRGE